MHLVSKIEFFNGRLQALVTVSNSPCNINIYPRSALSCDEALRWSDPMSMGAYGILTALIINYV
jgi:hypothetical protein